MSEIKAESNGKRKMKSWKIFFGMCGPTSLESKIIRAYTEEEAVKKYLGDKYDTTSPEEIAKMVENCGEHIPEPRVKKEDK